MTQTQPLSFIQKLRAKHQARAQDAAESGVIPNAFSDDPAFLNLVTVFSGKSAVGNPLDE